MLHFFRMERSRDWIITKHHTKLISADIHLFHIFLTQWKKMFQFKQKKSVPKKKLLVPGRYFYEKKRQSTGIYEKQVNKQKQHQYIINLHNSVYDFHY
jgi:hypothetical protein